MKASVLHAYGGPEVMRYEDFPDPVAASGEVLLRVAAASINPVDLLQRSGATAAYLPVQFPGVIGWDVSGTVEALGSGVVDFHIGDRVMAWAFHTFAELVAVETGLLARVPDKLDLLDAAALPLVATTGSQLISVASGLIPGQTVLVSGANGSVGRSAVFTALDQGAHVIAAVMARQQAEAQSLGAHAVVALDDPAAFAALPQVDIVANCVRGETAERLMGKVKQGGTFASVTGAPANAKRYASVRVVEFVSKQSPQTMTYIAEAVSAGKMAIPIDRRIPLRETAAGMVAVAKGGIGKVLLVP